MIVYATKGVAMDPATPRLLIAESRPSNRFEVHGEKKQKAKKAKSNIAYGVPRRFATTHMYPLKMPPNVTRPKAAPNDDDDLKQPQTHRLKSRRRRRLALVDILL
jgi:hypothetical protein